MSTHTVLSQRVLRCSPIMKDCSTICCGTAWIEYVYAASIVAQQCRYTQVSPEGEEPDPFLLPTFDRSKVQVKHMQQTPQGVPTGDANLAMLVTAEAVLAVVSDDAAQGMGTAVCMRV